MRPRPAVRTSTAGGSRPPSRRPLAKGDCSGRREHWAAFTRVPDGPELSAIGNQRHNGKTAKARTLSEGPPLGLPRNPVPTGIRANAGACSETLTRQHTTHNPGHGPLSTGQDREWPVQLPRARTRRAHKCTRCGSEQHHTEIDDRTPIGTTALPPHTQWMHN